MDIALDPEKYQFHRRNALRRHCAPALSAAQNGSGPYPPRMSRPIEPPRSALPPIAQFLAEAAAQRLAALPGMAAKPGTSPAAFPAPAEPGAALPAPPQPLPAAAAALADKASFSAQARAQLAAGFVDPRAGAGARNGARGTAAGGAPRAGLPGLTSGTPAGSTPGSAAASASALRGAAWPASGLAPPLQRLVEALVAQVTAHAGAPQRVLAAQPWPIALAQALESGALDADQPALHTWLVRQGLVRTQDGERGIALTLRVPLPWAGTQAQSSGALSPGAAVPALLPPFAGRAQALQSGVLALVLQGPDATAPRTSALLVLDVQPQLAASVYGREVLQQARQDPWTQMAVLQASGQAPRSQSGAREGSERLCDTAGCPYAARAVCVQPFCLALRGPLPTGPALPA